MHENGVLVVAELVQAEVDVTHRFGLAEVADDAGEEGRLADQGADVVGCLDAGPLLEEGLVRDVVADGHVPGQLVAVEPPRHVENVCKKEGFFGETFFMICKKPA